MIRSLLLSCETVRKTYGTRSLFEELSFGLFEGDQAGLVGPNGSGKSTLLKIPAGLEATDRGTRSVRGGVRVGYLPQDPVLAPEVTVEETIALALTGVDEGDRPGRIARAMGRAGFADGRAEVGPLAGGCARPGRAALHPLGRAGSQARLMGPALPSHLRSPRTIAEADSIRRSQ